MIVFDKVSKSYAEHQVLNKISLTIDKGEFVFLIGPSGAGKSTIFHLLMGADTPDSGHIDIDGVKMEEMDTAALQLYRRKVGMVWQNFKLLPKKTVFENVAFALEALNEDEEEINLRVPKILAKVGLKDMADKFPAQLSGGEKQRCAIARALIHSPNLIIADEPTGNLDPKTSLEIIEILKSINKSGVTIILATHDMNIVDAVKQRVMVIDNGKLVRDKKKSTYLG